ncbi:type II toxin-antitoxin system RelE/ParE family toxin [Polaromonas sp. C04]|uniref:type II toxin-antitoxin system RelE/ParE family toxin n=1 Tax=Polaromonas sp. C04 TaxID=1945857 RepID=UPI000984E695|nr:type II toxin-antitoxin system RelE/ParE family toxin [Polaromonas sp. C04]OOG49921.1 plasmid stabilization protein [Polaromonas sp. C04]
MRHTVVFTPEAQEQLAALYRYIAAAASPEIAERYTSAIVTYCEGLRDFPHRGTRRDDVRPGLRITNYKKRAVIAFAVDAEQVSIIGIFYGGQDYETALQSDLDD